MMKANAALALFLLAAPAIAQETAAKADYSRPTLLRIVVEAQREQDRRGIHWDGRSVTFRALGTNWHFMPIMLPFAGTRFATTREWPDAFSLTGTPIATSPRAWARHRELNKELRRIEKVTKPKAKVKVKTE
jgi:hypothetical protein